MSGESSSSGVTVNVRSITLKSSPGGLLVSMLTSSLGLMSAPSEVSGESSSSSFISIVKPSGVSSVNLIIFSSAGHLWT